MQNILTSVVFLLLATWASSSIAQVPQGINYQAVVRNSSGEIMTSSTVIFSFSIASTSNNTPLYSETQETITNEFGLVNLVIGNGVPTFQSFAGLNWDIPYEITTTLIIDESTINMGTTAFQSVPYALNAGSASSLLPTATVDPSQITPSGAVSNQILQFDGSGWVPANLPGGNGGGTGLDLPFAETDTYNQALFNVTNTDQNAIEGFSTNGLGVYGSSYSSSGVMGITSDDNYAGVSGSNFENGPGVKGFSENGHGVIGQSNSSSSSIYGVNNHGEAIRGQSDEEGMAAIVGYNAAEHSRGIMGIAHCADCIAVEAYTQNGTGFSANSAYKGAELYGGEIGADISTYGGTAVAAYAATGIAVDASSLSGTGIYAKSESGIALETDGKVKIAGIGQSPAQGKVLTSDGNGNATWQGGVAFAASGGGNQTIEDYPGEKVLFENEDYDFGNNFNSITREFIVPVHGIYHFDVLIDWVYSTDDFIGNIHLDFTRGSVTNTMMANSEEFDSNGHHNHDMSCEFELLAGDRVFVTVYLSSSSGSENLDTNDYTRFSGHMVMRL